MRCVLVLLVALVCLASASVLRPGIRISPIVKFADDAPPSFPQADAKTCEICINVAVEIINVGVNYILQGGVVNTCADICGLFNSSAISTICELSCDAVGIDVFVHILERTDIDPILYCQLVDMCKVLDCTGQCANITEMVPNPQVGWDDEKFLIQCGLNVTQPAGAGMLRFIIYPSSEPQNGQTNDQLMPEYDVGYYTFSVELIPSEAGMEPGNWTFELMACEGECGSQHEHSAIFSTDSTWIMVNKDTKKPFPIQRQRLNLRR